MSTALTRTPPWPTAPGIGSDANSRMAWYAAVARWAPSKHNSQPWHFVVRDGSLEVWADPLRVLAGTDAVRRELTISIGAAVGLAVVAAHAAGYDVTVRLLPLGDAGPQAVLCEVGPRAATPEDARLLAAVARRRTDRGPLDAVVLGPDLPFLLQSTVSAHGCSLRLVSTPGDRKTLAALVQRADRLLLARGVVDQELTPWLRVPGDNRRDGVPTDHTRGAAASVRAEFVQRDYSVPGSAPAHDRKGHDRPLVGVLCSPADSTEDWLRSGQALMAMLLRATDAGASASYLNQPIEETAIRSELRDELRLDGVGQLVVRVGKGGRVAPTARRYLRDLIQRT
jgi:hypothetical protein